MSSPGAAFWQSHPSLETEYDAQRFPLMEQAAALAGHVVVQRVEPSRGINPVARIEVADPNAGALYSEFLAKLIAEDLRHRDAA